MAYNRCTPPLFPPPFIPDRREREEFIPPVIVNPPQNIIVNQSLPPVGISATIPAQIVPGLISTYPIIYNTPFYQVGAISLNTTTGVVTFNSTGRYSITFSIQLATITAIPLITINAITTGSINGILPLVEATAVPTTTPIVLNTAYTISVGSVGSTLQFTVNNPSITLLPITGGVIGVQKIAP